MNDIRFWDRDRILTMSSIYSYEYQSIIKTLKARRIELKITQAQLAQVLGKPQSFVSKIESGERRLDIIEFVHIARQLSLDLNEVLEKIR
ncbi:helix-turn-helix transcriptional regulator [Edwardsiella piscicida]|uniref:helix-turn-helix domain-containing protein n=1 Tax=Edwardsiella TaxID=635 RepID=UPI000A07D041|nr:MULTISPECIES: helix-turn-helix transcriptional regulator [Edwardsiella]AOP44248.2 helix-turn-helix domain-containing protein [Edwardsiella piscicida]ATI64585.1 XRE family transcriptional regulator [Edwardsiella tarda]EKS7768250.1 helix-turn-helix transcriptional regulator [Edwardsiella piscicida]ELM3724030.1 helix-turn-helix transcriptional regulator [Edwardsiella piscicida]UCQ30864.1 helix-turn-helix domain-containing protein [Edwardsiella piscicida]